MAVIIPLKYAGGIKQFVTGDILGNALFGANAGAMVLGTTDANTIAIRLNNNERWRFSTLGYLARGAGGSAQTFGLQLFGSGAAATFTMGDLFDDDTPYVMLREYSGSDTDQFQLYGQKGGGLHCGVLGSTTPQLWITQAGKIAFNLSSLTPTAKAHFAGSSSGSNNAAIKIDAGTFAAAADGQLEYDGTNLAFCVSTNRYLLSKNLTTTAVLNFPSTAANSSQDLNVVVKGAAVNDIVKVGPPPGSVNTGCMFWGFVASANNVTVRHNNNTVAAVDPASGTFRVTVEKLS